MATPDWSYHTLLVLHVTITCSLSSYTDDVTVHTRYGRLRGTRVREEYELGPGRVTPVIDKFLGIPYAKPPVGGLRFKPPERPDGWKETRDATGHGHVCPQVTFHPGTSEGFQSEDCLYLDVYVPRQDSVAGAVYPVMVFIHGGSFEVGAGKLYDGTVLAQLGVIVVTINYRLGALGFMSAGSEELRGNLGIMDQVMALHWVQDNIESFHGDPRRVTVFGHSAGGASVGLLLVMPKAEGLFHGIIAQSGSAVASYCVHDDTIDFRGYLARVGSIFSCHQSDVTQILDCLRRVPARSFIHRRTEFPMYDPIDPEFRPYLDGSWVVDYPSNLFRKGNFSKVPVITGTVQNEFGNYFNGGARHRPTFDVALDRYVGSYVRHSDVMDVVKFEYKIWEPGVGGGYDRGSVLSDMHMVAPTVEMAEVIARYSDAIYQYHFTIDNCYHSLELNYVFGAPFSGRLADEMSVNTTPNFSRTDKLFSLQMMTMWTNFARLGNPTPEGSSGLPVWQPFTNAHKRYMQLHPEGLSMQQKLREDKVLFWNHLIAKLRRWQGPEVQSEYRDDIPLCTNCQYRVNLWVFLATVAALAILVLLLSILFIKTRMQNNRYKRTLCVQLNGKDGKSTKV